jgi:nucleoside-diphosphate-sugar epimerase
LGSTVRAPGGPIDMADRIFITGAAGKTGRALLALLAGDPAFAGARITCLSRPGSPCEALLPFGVRIAGGAASKPRSLAKVYGGEEIVIHLSSIFHTGAVLEACRGMKRLVAASSTRLFSKSWRRAGEIESAEAAIAQSGTPFTILRATMIYGAPDDRNISQLIRLVRKWSVVPLPGGGRAVFQPVHVDDLASCIVAALKTPASLGKTYNVPGGSAHSLREMIEMIAAALGKRVSTVSVPLPLAEAGAALAAVAGRRFARGAEQIRRLREDKRFDYTEAARDLGYSPRTFAEGLSLLVGAMYPSLGEARRSPHA